MLITSIKPNVTREQAVEKFRGGFNQLRHGRLRLAMDFYVPYRLYRLKWESGQKKASPLLAADAVTGGLDLIEFGQTPVEQETSRFDATRFADERIGVEEAYRLVRERVLRLVFRRGFFKLTRVNAEVELAASFHVPYWVGVYEREGQAHLEIINALQGRFEGVKLREIVSEWFHPQT